MYPSFAEMLTDNIWSWRLVCSIYAHQHQTREIISLLNSLCWNSPAVQKICGNRRPRWDRSPSATSLTSVWVHVLTHRQFRRSIYFSDELSFWFLLCRPRPANVLLQFRRQLFSNVSEHFGGLFLCLTLNFTTYFSQFSEHLCFVFLTFWFAHLPAVNSVTDCVS